MLESFSNLKNRSWMGLAALNVVLACIYFLLAKLGLTLATINQSVSPVWPATGFAFSIVYLFGFRTLPAVFVGAFVANWLQGGFVFSAICISFGNTSEALIGAIVLKAVFAREKQLGHQTATVAYAVASALGSLASASIGVATLYGTGAITDKNALVSVWTTWWIGDALGGLVLSPVIIQLRKFDLRWKESANTFGVLCMVSAVCWFVFFNRAGGGFLFLLFPVLLCALAGVGSFLVLLTSAIVCTVSVVATVSGHGPFAIGNLNERLVHLQLFLAAYAVTGLTLASISRARLSRLVAAVLVGCWALAGAIFLSFDASEKDITETHLTNLTEDSREKTLSQLDSIQRILRGGVGFFAASKSVEADEWQAFNKTVNVIEQHVGVNGLGVVWPLMEKNIPVLEREMKAQGHPNFRVKAVQGFESNSRSESQPRYVIKFVEPVQRNEAALGLDLSSEPNRRFAAELSRDTGLPAMTSKIVLAQDDSKTPGFLLFMPIYKINVPLDAVERRRAAHVGWVYAPVIYKNFFNQIFAQTSDELEMQVYEGEAGDPSNLVFSNFSVKSAISTSDREIKIAMGQKQFLIRWVKSPKFVSSRTTVIAWVAFCGSLAALLLAILILTIQSIGHRSREIADELTAELSASREKFKQGERRLLYALDGSNDGIWDWHVETAEMYVSGKIAETHGWPQTFRARSVKDLSSFVHPDDSEMIRVSIDRLYSGQTTSHEVETRYRTTRGEWRWVLTRGKISERNSYGVPTRMTGVHIDIHELKTAQGLLEETQYQLKNIANTVPTMISLWNNELKCEFANDLFCKWFGLTPDQVTGRALRDLVGEKFFEERVSIFQKALSGEQLHYERETVRAVDSANRHVIATYLPNKRGENLHGFFLFVQDITDLKNAELKALDGQKIAVDAVKMKSQFLANMSHEIRTPLNGVVGVANLLKETELDRVQQDYCDIISRSSESLLSIINDILDFSKVEAGKLDLELVDFNLEELLHDALRALSFSAKAKGLSLTSDLKLSSKYFTGDPGRIRQVLTNLIGNSIKFTEAGGVTLRVVEERASVRSRLKFEILDTGIGMSEAVRERMFQAFAQADATMTRRFGGTGLGLSISKQLVTLMDGDIGVESTLGVGSNFWFRVELSHGSKVSDTALSYSTTVITATNRRGHILVVEDNKVNQLVVTANLKRMGMTFDVAENGFEALTFLTSKSCDLILMDCQMPEMDGYEATAKIRQLADAEVARLPIIALTANAFKGDFEHCLAVGMNDYLTKPINVSALALILDKWLPAGSQSRTKLRA